MKTKLLKKIRKRFTIEYYPLGVPSKLGDTYISKYLLIDAKNKCNRDLFLTKDDALEYILSVIKDEYKKYTNKRNKNKPIKVWYNG